MFEADVSPIGSAFDRACELYQCLTGKFRLEALCREKGLELSEAVYGREHVRQCHGGRYYKIKYLKSIDIESGSMLAYPEGIPGWDF